MLQFDSRNRWGLAFHHLGLAVKEPKTAETFLTGLGYSIGETVFDPLQNVNLSMCSHLTMPDVEIIFPAGSEGMSDCCFSGAPLLHPDLSKPACDASTCCRKLCPVLALLPGTGQDNQQHPE